MAIPDPLTTEWVPIWNPLSEGPAGPPGDTTPYRDLLEGTYANPAADTARVYALDVNGYTQVEMKDSAGRGVRFSSDNVIIAKITEPAGVARGQAVYIAGAAGANSLVRLAKADNIATMPVIGIVLDAGAVNAFTRILSVGTLQGVDTSAFVEGVSLFASPTVAGGFTATLPLAPNYAQRVGFVTRSHATQGEILVLTTGVLADPRLHHATHETGGTDAITALAGSVITTGTVADARLSANVPLKNAANVFTESQRIDRAGIPSLILRDLSQPADTGTSRIVGAAGYTYIQGTNDAVSAGFGQIRVHNTTGQLEVSGKITERNRTTPMGEWQSVPFNAANFIGIAGMTWTVTGANVLTNRYTLVGQTLIWTLYINGSTLGGTASNVLQVNFPIGGSTVTSSSPVARFLVNGVHLPTVTVYYAGQLGLARADFSYFPLGTLDLAFTIAVEFV